ncbi:MAG: efflux RND transporter periplasmic adaptor subunit [Candidatus Paceibacterota bacterium]
MNRHLEKVINDTKDIKNQLWSWYKELSRPKQIGVGAAVLVLFVVIVRAFTGTAPVSEIVKAPRAVTLALVSDLTNNESALPLLGTVTSTSEATIRAESSGKLTRVYKKLGDYVTAGQVIAEFENSAERASLLQAEGSYDAAKAARDISRINSGSTNSSLSDTKTNALSAISNAYATMDDVIRAKTDNVYSSPRESSVHFMMSVPDAHLTLSLEDRRRNIERSLVLREARNRTLTTDSDLVAELNTVQTEAQAVKSYFDDLATAYSKALTDSSFTQAAIDSGKTTVGIARSTIAGTIGSLSASRTALNASLAASLVAGKTSGDTDANVTSADAQVKQAQGAYNAALSRLEKTVVRSPITGTLNSLSIETGDFVSAFTEVAIVSNNGALEVLAYVTEDDAKRAAVGSPVMIDGVFKGVITRIASAIDPRTKKIEVRIGITDKTSSLINGQSVRISVSRTQTKVTTAVQGPIHIPLSALKITPKGSFVFTMSTSSSLVSVPVEIGALMGEEIQILSGITGDLQIVKDARGLKEGMIVTVTQ